MGSISLREFIQWLPDEPSEPTSTIVVTSPGRRFVDIRVLRPASAPASWPTNEGESKLPFFYKNANLTQRKSPSTS